MIKVALVGTGTVSQHLEKVFSKTFKKNTVKVISSRGESLSKSLKSDYKEEQPDIYIIAVSDDAINSVANKLENTNSLVVHTSGSVAVDVFKGKVRSGVFYPLQTFSKGRDVDFKTIPVCIEANNKEDLELLRELAESVSESVYEISSEQRKALHLVAVFVNNFTNHLYQIGNKICEENQVPFDILKPLIAETVKKIDSLPPIDAQTGPARRNDQETIERHLGQLINKTHKEIYQILTKSIKETYGKEL